MKLFIKKNYSKYKEVFYYILLFMIFYFSIPMNVFLFLYPLYFLELSPFAVSFLSSLSFSTHEITGLIRDLPYFVT